jgi:thiol peroxidase
MVQERKGAVTLKGNPLTVEGSPIKVGDSAPNFTAYKGLGDAIEGQSLSGKIRFISVVPSLDTSICDIQTKRFNEEAQKINGKDVEWLTISIDTPLAQGRWCGAANAKNIKVISDYKDHSFGHAFGVYVKEIGLLQRSIFIIGKDDKVKYVQLVPEITQHPNYDEALDALKGLLN